PRRAGSRFSARGARRACRSWGRGAVRARRPAPRSSGRARSPGSGSRLPRHPHRPDVPERYAVDLREEPERRIPEDVVADEDAARAKVPPSDTELEQHVARRVQRVVEENVDAGLAREARPQRVARVAEDELEARPQLGLVEAEVAQRLDRRLLAARPDAQGRVAPAVAGNARQPGGLPRERHRAPSRSSANSRSNGSSMSIESRGSIT